MVNAGGLALGPLVGGLFARFADQPLHTPFAVFLVVLLGEAVAVSLVPETVERREERPAYRPQRLSLPAAARSEFAGAAIGVFAAFALSGLFMALAPTLLAQELHEPSRLLAGLAPFTMLGSAALAQIGLARLRTRSQLRAGYALMGAGLVLLAVRGIAAAVLRRERARGGGFGLGFRAAVGTVAALADDLDPGRGLGSVVPRCLRGSGAAGAADRAGDAGGARSVVLAGFAVLELGLLGWSARRTLGRA